MATSETATATANGDLTQSQIERRGRILEAAKILAIKGGYDAVQMRDVAERADVALGTLYRYFPSKVHLLISIMQDETARLADRLERRPVEGDTAAERVIAMLDRATAALQRAPSLTEAMTRALMFADASAASDVHNVTSITTEAIIHAMHGPDREPSEDDEAIARVIEMVWLTSILGWLSGRASAAQMSEDLEVATGLLLR